jgi:hypothetical protein
MTLEQELTELLAVAEAIKAEAGVIDHQIIDPISKDGHVLFGLAFPQRKLIRAPAGATIADLYLLAHECGHCALRHDHQKPRYVREYEAELWAHAALQRHGIDVPEGVSADACLNVFNAIDEANKRGQFCRRQKKLSAEAAEWSGWNYMLQQLEEEEAAL